MYHRYKSYVTEGVYALATSSVSGGNTSASSVEGLTPHPHRNREGVTTHYDITAAYGDYMYNIPRRISYMQPGTTADVMLTFSSLVDYLCRPTTLMRIHDKIDLLYIYPLIKPPTYPHFGELGIQEYDKTGQVPTHRVPDGILPTIMNAIIYSGQLRYDWSVAEPVIVDYGVVAASLAQYLYPGAYTSLLGLLEQRGVPELVSKMKSISPAANARPTIPILEYPTPTQLEMYKETMGTYYMEQVERDEARLRRLDAKYSKSGATGAYLNRNVRYKSDWEREQERSRG